MAPGALSKAFHIAHRLPCGRAGSYRRPNNAMTRLMTEINRVACNPDPSRLVGDFVRDTIDVQRVVVGEGQPIVLCFRDRVRPRPVVAAAATRSFPVFKQNALYSGFADALDMRDVPHVPSDQPVSNHDPDQSYSSSVTGSTPQRERSSRLHLRPTAPPGPRSGCRRVSHRSVDPGHPRRETACRVRM